MSAHHAWMSRFPGPERLLRGVPAAPGMAFGLARRLDAPAPDAEVTVPEAGREAERARALAALAAAAAEIDGLAAKLAGPEAEIVATGALLARDPALVGAVEETVATGRPKAL